MVANAVGDPGFEAEDVRDDELSGEPVFASSEEHDEGVHAAAAAQLGQAELLADRLASAVFGLAE